MQSDSYQLLNHPIHAKVKTKVSHHDLRGQGIILFCLSISHLNKKYFYYSTASGGIIAYIHCCYKTSLIMTLVRPSQTNLLLIIYRDIRCILFEDDICYSFSKDALEANYKILTASLIYSFTFTHFTHLHRQIPG